MRRPATELDPELEAWLQFRKVERHIRPEIRARVLDRSRAMIFGTSVFTPPPDASTAVSASVQRSSGLARLALTAAIAGAVGAVGVIAAHRARAPVDAPAADRQLPIPGLASEMAASDRSPEAPPVALPHAITPKPARAPSGAHPFTGEIELLERAHLAYARRDFSVALALVREHARRFPRGPLAEEREALRVESLVGLGLTDEARRLAAAYAARFPRSVLLSRVEEAAQETVP
jgi:hypothetical protein